jgi:ribose 5-phosphate isomerase B
MRIALAADHRGFALKGELAKMLSSLGHEVADHGAYALVPDDDYPDYIVPACEAVAKGNAERGIVIGYSGQGEAIAANKVPGIRSALYYGGPEEILRLSREDNDANVLSLGAGFLDAASAFAAVRLWLDTSFSHEARHLRRLGKLPR